MQIYKYVVHMVAHRYAKTATFMPKTVFDAGKTQISVLSVVPWSSVKDSLKPKFPISGEAALQLAIPTTSAFEDHLLDAVKVAVGIGLPTSGVTKTETTITVNTGPRSWWK